MNEKQITEAIHATIAKTILEGIDTEARDALLQKSITSAITDWKFTSGINDVVAKKAMAVVHELVESEDWTQRITDAIRAGFDEYLMELTTASQKMLKKSMHGEGGTYSSEGAILRVWPKK